MFPMGKSKPPAPPTEPVSSMTVIATPRSAAGRSLRSMLLLQSCAVAATSPRPPRGGRSQAGNASPRGTGLHQDHVASMGLGPADAVCSVRCAPPGAGYVATTGDSLAGPKRMCNSCVSSTTWCGQVRPRSESGVPRSGHGCDRQRGLTPHEGHVKTVPAHRELGVPARVGVGQAVGRDRPSRARYAFRSRAGRDSDRSPLASWRSPPAERLAEPTLSARKRVEFSPTNPSRCRQIDRSSRPALSLAVVLSFLVMYSF